MAPSLFHPSAYMPTFINPAVDVEANQYYPFKAGGGHDGLPRISVVGNVPLYNNEKAFAAYSKV